MHGLLQCQSNTEISPGARGKAHSASGHIRQRRGTGRRDACRGLSSALSKLGSSPQTQGAQSSLTFRCDGQRALSSAGERCLHTAEVTGSIPVAPTGDPCPTRLSSSVPPFRSVIARTLPADPVNGVSPTLSGVSGSVSVSCTVPEIPALTPLSGRGAGRSRGSVPKTRLVTWSDSRRGGDADWRDAPGSTPPGVAVAAAPSRPEPGWKRQRLLTDNNRQRAAWGRQPLAALRAIDAGPSLAVRSNTVSALPLVASGRSAGLG